MKAPPMPSPSGEITHLLNAWSRNDRDAGDRVLQMVYPEMRRIAGYLLARRRGEISLQVTELVNETYLRLAGQDRARWLAREHFYSVAASVLRRVIVDHYRRKRRLRRGGRDVRVDLDHVTLAVDPSVRADVLDLDDALLGLEKADPTAAQLVELRFFAGLTVDEAAGALGIGRTAAVELWQYARCWLALALKNPGPVVTSGAEPIP